MKSDFISQKEVLKQQEELGIYRNNFTKRQGFAFWCILEFVIIVSTLTFNAYAFQES